MLKNKGGFKTPLFALNCGSIHILHQYLFKVCDVKRKYLFLKMRVEIKH
jgi:hypothetical protein